MLELNWGGLEDACPLKCKQQPQVFADIDGEHDIVDDDVKQDRVDYCTFGVVWPMAP